MARDPHLERPGPGVTERVIAGGARDRQVALVHGVTHPEGWARHDTVLKHTLCPLGHCIAEPTLRRGTPGRSPAPPGSSPGTAPRASRSASRRVPDVSADRRATARRRTGAA